MAYTTINKPEDYFNTKLYTGTGADNNAITGINFRPDWVWIKSRSGTHSAGVHELYDAVRGTGKMISSNQTNAEATGTNRLKSFDSDGFTMGDHNQINGGSTNYASWNWKAGTTSGLTTNGTTTITPTSYSFNSTSGFSILKFTGNGAAGAYVAHGLGTTPNMIIVKKTSGAAGWFVYHSELQSTYNLYLNDNNGKFGGAYVYSPDATNFRLRDHNDVNQSGETYIAYCFAEKTGFSKIGSYTGNGNANGTFVYTGFKPAFLIIKADAQENWHIFDNKRNTINPTQRDLRPNLSNAESDSSAAAMDFLSNGFKLRNDDNDYNKSATEYIYMAFAEKPLVGSNNVAVTAK